MPDSLRSLSNLEFLDLSYTGLNQLPRAVVTLNKLESLKIGHTHISELPNDFSLLKNLKHLDFSQYFPHHDDSDRTRIAQIRQVLADCAALETLNLSQQRVRFASGQVRNWLNLTSLDLSYNGMAELPEELWLIPNLETVDLSFNRLTQLDGIEAWQSLRHLSLIDNPLHDLSPLVGLQALETLDMRRIHWSEPRREALQTSLPQVEITWS